MTNIDLHGFVVQQIVCGGPTAIRVRVGTELHGGGGLPARDAGSLAADSSPRSTPS